MTVARIMLMAAASATGLAALALMLPVSEPQADEVGPSNGDTTSTAAFHALAERFDGSALPPPKPAEAVAEAIQPPPDPALGLKGYRFIGVAASDARSAGVFERGGETLVLAPGAALEGFTLASVNAAGALFTNGDARQVSLSLETTAPR